MSDTTDTRTVTMPEDLALRCEELFRWRSTGTYDGTLLAELAETYERDHPVDAMQMAEQETIREFLRVVAGAELRPRPERTPTPGRPS